MATVEAIGHELRRGSHVMRYVAADDFGSPKSAFLICDFWLADALWEIGQREEARDIFVNALRMRNRYGLLSEDVHPVTGKLWGNFPQTYSMSGLIFDGNRAVGEAGETGIGWRLVVVSNRVAGFLDRGHASRRTRSGDPRPALKRHGGLWFGWSGRVAEDRPRTGQIGHAATIFPYATVDLGKDDLPGILQWLRQSSCCGQFCTIGFDLAEFTRRRSLGYFRVNQYFATPS